MAGRQRGEGQGVDADVVERLLEPCEGPCVSLFIPTHGAGRDAQQDPLRWKHVVEQAERLLIEGGHRGPDARELVRPARDLAGDSRFWNRQAAGLAAYLAPGRSDVLAVPVPVPERTVVGSRFHVRPLLPALWPDQEFLILALSLSGARLLRGTRFRVQPVELRHAPAGLEDVTKFVEAQSVRQFHSGERRGSGLVAVPHGHGGGKDDYEERVVEYLRAVAQSVTQTVGSAVAAPLVVAGVSYLRGLYQDVHVNGAGGQLSLLGEGVDGSPDKLDDAELHAATWALVEPLAHAQVEQAVAALPQALAKGGVRRDVGGVLVAALQGRVGTLLVDRDAVQWGRFDEQAGRAHLHDSWRAGDDELLDKAAALTVKAAGKVFELPADRIPDGRRVTALLRY